MSTTRRIPGRTPVAWYRILTIAAMLGGLLAVAEPTLAAPGGVDGDSFTGVNFDWSVEWDAATWEVVDEDNTGGSDYFLLKSSVHDFGMVGVYARGDFASVGGCTKHWVDSIGHADGSTDVERIDDPVEIPVRSDAATATFTFTQERRGSIEALIGYVQCLPVDGVGAYVALHAMAFKRDFGTMIPDIGSVLKAIETPRAEIASLAADHEADAVSETVDEDATEEESAPETDDDSREETDEDGQPEQSGQDGDSGVDGTTFTGVFYDWSVGWDENDWEFDEEDNRDGYDSLWLENADGEWAMVTFVTTADVTEAEDCATGWLRTMAGVRGATDVGRDDTLDTPPLPDDAAGYAYTYRQGDIDVAAYVECRMFPGATTRPWRWS